MTETTGTTDAAQLALFPAGEPKSQLQNIRLDMLPPDEKLPSPPPSGALVTSVRKVGVLQAIGLEHGRSPQRFTYRVLWGRRRIKAARQAGLVSIPAMIYEPGQVNPAAVAVIENEQRSQNLQQRLVDVQALRHHPEREICAELGLKPQVLRSIQRILTDLHPVLLAAVMEGRIRNSVAEAASKRPADQQEVLAEQYVRAGKLLLKDVAAAARVGTETAVAGLPTGLFGGEPADAAAPELPEVVSGTWSRGDVQVTVRMPREQSVAGNAWALRAEALLLALVADCPDSEPWNTYREALYLASKEARNLRDLADQAAGAPATPDPYLDEEE